MVERTPVLDIVCHAILIAGGLLVCVPIYFAFVAGSLTAARGLQVPLPWLPGDRFFANAATAWQKGNFGRLFLNSLVVAVGIAVGKIARVAALGLRHHLFPLPLPDDGVLADLHVADAAGRGAHRADLRGGGERRACRCNVVGSTSARRSQDQLTLDWNMVNSYGGLILPLIASATATFLFRQFFLTVPDELCEAARIDGASPLQFFR